MNLNQIQTRIAELSAELLTLSNDMTFMLQGEVKRPEVPAFSPFDWRTLRENDLVHLQEGITAPGGIILAPGIYKVEMVEDKDYIGTLPFSVWYDEENERSTWIHFNSRTHTLFRKV
jgi:hypothetical protein